MLKIPWMVLLTALIVFTGCSKPEKKQYDKPLGPGELALRKITDPSRLPDLTWACYDLHNLAATIDNSLEYFSKPSSEKYFPYGQISYGKAVDSLKAMREMLNSGMRAEELKRQIMAKFDIYESVGCDNAGTVLFTGYYTPIFDGSRERSGVYQYPLYGLPDDLVKDSEGNILGRKLGNGSVVKYPSRAEIESSNMLSGRELIWMKDKFDVYVAHVQGSAKIRLEDGSLITLGYAGNNGHEYRSINAELVKDNQISADQINLSRMISFFKLHPTLLDSYVNKNPRFVFFREQDTQPVGSLNVEVTEMRTIATDKSVYPRGCLAFIDTKLPKQMGNDIVKQPFSGFMLDQDTGGAIRAPGRCDIYMGIGDHAGKLAGYTCEEGRLYYLFLK